MTDTEEPTQEAVSDPEAPKSPYGVLFYPLSAVIHEAARLIGDMNTRLDNLAAIVSQDPVVLLEVLKTSNALFFSPSNPLTTAKVAVARLGADSMKETLASLIKREKLMEPLSQKWFEIHRNRCKRTGIVARILAEATAKNFSDDLQAAGCLMGIGDLLAVSYLGEAYTSLAESTPRSTLAYKLVQKHHFDIETMRADYLRRYGIPDAIVSALDREAKMKNPERGVMKSVCFSALEMVDYFDANKWEKLAPGKALAPKSPLRLLQLTDAQYLKVYERASEYLFADRMQEASRQASSSISPSEDSGDTASTDIGLDAELQAEIDFLLGSGQLAAPVVGDSAAQIPASLSAPTIASTVASSVAETSSITTVREVKGEMDGQFMLNPNTSKTTPRVQASTNPVEPPKMVSARGNAFLQGIQDLFAEAQSSEELLSKILEKLTDGPFEKAALIVVSQDRKEALVIAARGSISKGQRLALNDPLSPLAQCFSKVQSFSSVANEASPWGCTSFAVAPIDADHGTPVALYADCGHDGALTFEARRIFRNVVDILNQRLPTIPGGIPVEI